MVDLFVSGARLFGKVFGVLGELSKWIFALLAVASLALTLVATLMYVTSRGLYAGRAWARILGIVLALAPLILSLLALASVRRPLPLTAATLAAALSLYVLWSLTLRFD